MKLHEIKPLNETFMTDHDEIKAWLDSMKVTNYTIRDNGIVDSEYAVDISNKKLTSIPVQFGKVQQFYCAKNKLTSLKGCPSEVELFFGCHTNLLTSFDGAPAKVGKAFDCLSNKIVSLEGIADNLKELHGIITLDNRKIKSHVLGLMLIEGLRQIDCIDKWANILNRCIEDGVDVYEAQMRLHKAGLDEYALA